MASTVLAVPHARAPVYHHIDAGIAPDLPINPTFPCFEDGSSGKRVQGIYEYLSENRIKLVRHQLQDILGSVNLLMDPTGTKRVRYVTNGKCRPRISVIKYGTSLPDNPDRKYVVFSENDGYCGQSDIVADEQPGPENLNNSTSVTAWVGGGCWGTFTATHELAHALGAVQWNAPHSTHAGHCFDGADVMCYQDTSGIAPLPICPDLVYDCNGDDYFSLHPSGWLADHWNIANSMFLG